MSTGEILIDKYKLLSPPLATGQTTQVWEVTEANSTKRVAMKLLLPEAFKLLANKVSLKHEHKAGKMFDHPNIIKYHEIVVAKKHAYFIMELFRAPNLKQQIKTDLNMVQVRFKRLVELTCMALEHVHEKGWLHRDIKPDNILFNRGSEVKLIDFSLSSPVGGALSKLFGGKGKGPIQGTRSYIAPEQILNKRLSIQTDLYSLGITIFEMLTGKSPFFGGTPKALLIAHLSETAPNPSFYDKNITPEMDRIVARLLSKKPVNRHKRAAEVWAELRTIDVFKEAVKDYAEPTEAEKQAVAAEAAKSLDQHLDSRADVARQDAIRLNPELGVELEAAKKAFKSRRAANAAAAAKRVEGDRKLAAPTSAASKQEQRLARLEALVTNPAAPTPAMGGYYPQPMPGLPLPPPGYLPAMPGYGMPPPGVPPGYMPGMPYPNPQPPMMPPPMAAPPPPYAAPPQGMPPRGVPAVPQPAAPPPVAPAPPTPAPEQARAAPAAPTPAIPAAPRPTTPAVATPAAKPKSAPAKPKPVAPPAPAQPKLGREEGFNVSDLPDFDQLPSA